MITSNPIIGTGLHAIGGISAASCYLPNTRTRQWSWGTFWLAQALFALGHYAAGCHGCTKRGGTFRGKCKNGYFHIRLFCSEFNLVCCGRNKAKHVK